MHQGFRAIIKRKWLQMNLISASINLLQRRWSEFLFFSYFFHNLILSWGILAEKRRRVFPTSGIFCSKVRWIFFVSQHLEKKNSWSTSLIILKQWAIWRQDQLELCIILVFSILIHSRSYLARYTQRQWRKRTKTTNDRKMKMLKMNNNDAEEQRRCWRTTTTMLKNNDNKAEGERRQGWRRTTTRLKENDEAEGEWQRGWRRTTTRLKENDDEAEGERRQGWRRTTTRLKENNDEAEGERRGWRRRTTTVKMKNNDEEGK